MMHRDGSAGVGPSGGPGLAVDHAGWQEADIPRRDWIARGYLMRGCVTLVAGAAGVSKSTMIVGWSIALALGEAFNRFKPTAPMRVTVFNVEDDPDEQRRRFSAALRQFRAKPSDIAGRISRVAPLGIGTLLEFMPDNGRVRETAAMLGLREHLAEFKPDVLILDPLAELHSAPENDNIALRAVMAQFRAFAAEAGIAIMLVHHTRKGPQIAGDPDAARGASSIIGAARIALTVTGMQPEEVTAFGLKPEQRRHYFRLDGSKSNYAPLVDGEWFQRITVELSNGDEVAAPEPWSPPVDAVTVEARLAIEAGIATGSPLGPWAPKLSTDARSVKQLFVQHGVITARGQKQLLIDLSAKGFVVAEFYRGNRAIAQGLRTPDGKPSNVPWR